MTNVGISTSGSVLRVVKFLSNVDSPEGVSIPIKVDGTKTVAVIDTGAMVNAIHERKLTWPYMRDECLEYVRKCVACQRFNIAKRGYHPLKTIHARMPMDHVAIDLAGPFVEAELTGNRYILVVVDVCTRFVFLRSIPDKSASTVAEELFKLFCQVGFPNVIQSDNGTEFKNELLTSITAKAGVEHRFVSPYHPRGNGLAERFVQTAKLTVAKLIRGDISTWDRHVNVAQYAMNTKVAAIHNSTPFSLFFGRQLRGAGMPSIQNEILTEEELKERVDYMTRVVFPAIDEGVRNRQKEQENKFTKGVLKDPFPVGSYVMTEDPSPSNALLPKWEGPYKVVRRNKGGAYVLEDLTKKLLASNVAPSRMKLVQRDPVEDDSDIFEVQQILAHRPIEGTNDLEYLVRWKGYSSEHDSWEPFTSFIETTMIEKYRKRRGIESDERSGSKPVQSASKVRKTKPGSRSGSRPKSARRPTRTTHKAVNVSQSKATRKSNRIAAVASKK